MCRPEHFTVSYAINPWMDPATGADRERAIRQWEALRAAYAGLGHGVSLIDPVEGLPDMVFGPTARSYFPGAFSPGSRAVLERMFPDAISAGEADAAVLGLNAVSDGRHIVINAEATGLIGELDGRGYEPIPVDLSELRKAGGGPKCCTLELRAEPTAV
ncbi:MAG TPA: hypothetical protein VH912_31090 [Streptosporangiaceae bacterium]